MMSSQNFSNIAGNPVVRQCMNICMVEVDGLLYVVSVEDYLVSSVLPADMPRGGGSWQSGWADEGIKYVAKGRSRSAADSQWRRYVAGLEN